MKSSLVILVAAGASLLTLVLSVVISVSFVEISPKNLSDVIKKDPYAFMEAVRVAGEKYREVAQKKALVAEGDRIKKELANPKRIKTKNRVTFGSPSAPVTVVEFSDFQCPYCAKANTRMKSLISKYNGKVNVVYKHFPLSFHPFAKPAAEYFEAVAAVNKDKARKFHDLIFDNFSSYARAKDQGTINKLLRSLVKQVGLSMGAVQKNMAQARKIVAEDMKEAEVLNVRGTPSFFVNGVNPGRKRIEDVIDIIIANSK